MNFCTLENINALAYEVRCLLSLHVGSWEIHMRTSSDVHINESIEILVALRVYV